ncbi:hypothetical protein GMLC_21620 [Geomonas limicola]|uniref:Uncharacterized protein n=1 Tax=Geomonas limicola TaxID=2740186 RepID=A0A6V8NAK9_9BACT|nr:hypothetical protein [Geomonas limicola]GFO68583.1 hypothetical protein GMLC_21620 [Geomonas limicola]
MFEISDACSGGNMSVEVVREHGGRPPLEGPASLADSVAWWLLTGVNQPDQMALFIKGSDESHRQRQTVANRVHHLLIESENAGIRPIVEGILTRLMQE